ncbi:hypothetical protein [Paenisporosarcina antarctica]|uniref:Uncharacterized protein n=1 Tax=Paenisporosarcina antarctica TaxID=417367 RepID=A0A4P7A3N0_9BACL|nr:hypothetical protein [Paenisporosarcina antarctica]QBP42646.1 hypothetical protein E2636_16500 [Paenisporosarcina antarctica]
MEQFGDSTMIIDHSISVADDLLEIFKDNKKQFFIELNSYSTEFKIKLRTNNYLIEKQKNIIIEIEKLNDIEKIYLKRTLPNPLQKIYLSVENDEIISIYK